VNAKIESIDRQVKEWEKRKREFYLSQESYKNQIDQIKLAYTQNDTSILPQYAQLVLKSSQYPDFITKNFDINYNPETKILVVEYSLPSIEVLPTLKEVKWVGNEQREYHVSETQLQNDFEKTMYNITLRTIYELFHTDAINAIDSICFNGWVNVLNKATGNRENHCILSLQVSKNIFNVLDLRHVDPKICFKSLKGVSSNKLSTITSIQPIIHINRNDKRFVDSHDVTGNIDESTNLAAMDWEDFEHLIREIFEKEFSSNGGEVKVTQASRDGGVDAIAFDPDPIRGGKIVIQAKRYTNTVGVSAVRDLFGTVMNEGANKGILVTTSDYGPDSYEFAKGKPLTLLNGGNLLYLLEKHGHNARINIEEARKLMKT
jgi:restriction system protein